VVSGDLRGPGRTPPFLGYAFPQLGDDGSGVIG
jgi:hypothetical protein